MMRSWGRALVAATVTAAAAQGAPRADLAQACFAAQFDPSATWTGRPAKRNACAAILAAPSTTLADKSTAQAIIGLIDRLADGPAQGKQACDDAAKRDPGNAMAQFCKGTIALDLDAWAEGMAALSMAAAAKPDWALPQNNLGTGYADMGLQDKAIEAYDRALKLRPNWPEAHNNRANAYVWKGLFDRGIQDYDKAIALNPKLGPAFNGRGNAFLSKGDTARAIQDFDAALALSPNDPDVLNNRGMAYRDKGDYARALQDLDQAIALNPKRAQAFGNRGLTFQKLEKYDEAIRDLKQALALNKKLSWAEQALSEAAAAQAALTARKKAQAPAPASALKRVALVIGNAKYANGVAALKNPEKDAAAIAKALTARGYQIFGYPKTNLTRDEMFAAVKAFEAASANADVSFVWYAGHGHEFPLADNQKGNFLVPIDIAKDDDILQKGFPLTRLMTAASTGRKLRVVVIDACRDSGLMSGGSRGGGGGGRGFAVEGRSDMLIVYSTRAGDVAADGDGANSPFAAAFLDVFGKNPAADARILFSGVAGKTLELTGRSQSPEQVNRLTTLDPLPLAQ